ncbi:MAG: FtsX-like permease family protein [Bacteroidia bacterium]|nr:FtsX-like permease family protein [Bacteroidia bacterium]
MAIGQWAGMISHGSGRTCTPSVKLAPGTDVRTLEAKFPAVVSQYKPGLAERNEEDILTLQPLEDIHLNAHLAEEFELNGDAQIVRVMAIIGLFVILIAWINYVNLSTAKAMERAREVGVRKVMGAFKGQLMRQFLIEAALVNFIAVVIAFGIVALAWPRFNNIAGLSLDMSYLFQSWFLLLMVALWLAGTLLSGFYPAVVLSSFRPVVVLKGKLRNSGGGILLRKSLVVLQFMASVGLIAGTLIVYKQLNFMMQQDIGMNIDQVLVVERPGISPRDRQAFNSAIDVFRDEIKKNREIKSVSASVTIPGKQREYKANVKPYGAPDDKLISVRFNSMDYDFIEVFQMKLVAGRTFSEEFPADQDTSVIITESAAKLLGYNSADEAVGQTLAVPQFQFNPIIVGVVNDYHQVSFKQALDPTVFYCTLYGGEFYSMRLQTTELSGTIEHARASWSKAFPGNPFDFFFSTTTSTSNTRTKSASAASLLHFRCSPFSSVASGSLVCRPTPPRSAPRRLESGKCWAVLSTGYLCCCPPSM